MIAYNSQVIEYINYRVCDLIEPLLILLALSLERDDSIVILNYLSQVISIIHLNSIERVNLLDIDDVDDNNDIAVLNTPSLNNRIILHSLVILI